VDFLYQLLQIGVLVQIVGVEMIGALQIVQDTGEEKVGPGWLK
jgi:hypothetical protein